MNDPTDMTESRTGLVGSTSSPSRSVREATTDWSTRSTSCADSSSCFRRVPPPPEAVPRTLDSLERYGHLIGVVRLTRVARRLHEDMGFRLALVGFETTDNLTEDLESGVPEARHFNYIPSDEDGALRTYAANC